MDYLGACFCDVSDPILHRLDKTILLVSDGTFSTLKLQIHLSQNRSGDMMFNFLVTAEESWYYDVLAVGPSEFLFLILVFGGRSYLKIHRKDRTL